MKTSPLSKACWDMVSWTVYKGVCLSATWYYTIGGKSCKIHTRSVSMVWSEDKPSIRYMEAYGEISYRGNGATSCPQKAPAKYL